MVSQTYSPLGVSVMAYDPVYFSINRNAQIRLDKINSWGHTIDAYGGFGQASFSFAASEREIDDWLENGLCKNIVAYGIDLAQIYEGYVNTVKVSYGGLSATRGPVFDIGNRVSVVYTPILDDKGTKGTATETPIVDDTDSQDRYGIIEKILSGGELIDFGTIDEAEEVRDLYLEESKWPYTDEVVNLEGGSSPTITIECGGYQDWLDAYAYNNLTDISTTVSDKVEAVIAADPNGIFSTNYSYIDNNMVLTSTLEEENRMAGTIIKGLISLGGGTANRWLFGVYENRVVKFSEMPSDPEYIHRVSSRSQHIETTGGRILKPWQVRPGKWAIIPDFMVLRTSNIVRRLDPRYEFIESVKFTAPNGLNISGSRTGKLSQRMAQLGIGGRS